MCISHSWAHTSRVHRTSPGGTLIPPFPNEWHNTLQSSQKVIVGWCWRLRGSQHSPFKVRADDYLTSVRRWCRLGKQRWRHFLHSRRMPAACLNGRMQGESGRHPAPPLPSPSMAGKARNIHCWQYYKIALCAGSGGGTNTLHPIPPWHGTHPKTVPAPI